MPNYKIADPRLRRDYGPSLELQKIREKLIDLTSRSIEEIKPDQSSKKDDIQTNNENQIFSDLSVLFLFLSVYSIHIIPILAYNGSMSDTDITYIFFALSLALALAVIWLSIKLIKMDRLRKEFFTSGLNKDLEQILIDQNRSISAINTELASLDKSINELFEDNKNNFQKIGFMRFNPFDDAGGNISFALALLDAHNDGIVISSLHGREGTRVYAKTVYNGVSESKLTEEESKAIKQAQ